MSWVALVPAILVAALLVLLPGFLVTGAARIRGVAALALAGPAGLALVAVSGVVLGAVGVPWGWWGPVGLGAVVAGAVVLVRRGAHPFGADGPRATLLVAAACGVAAVVTGAVAFGGVPEADRISQTYDGVFHLSAAAAIADSGNASSLTLYTIAYPGDAVNFYPAVWHSLVALVSSLTGVSIAAATNAVWIGATGAVWPAGCAWLVQVLLGGDSRRRRTLVAALGALLSSVFAGFPVALLSWGTLYPNGLATALLPAGLALLAVALPWPVGRRGWSPQRLPAGRATLLLVVWVAAAAGTHPRTIVSAAVLATPLLVAWFASRMRLLAASRGGHRRVALWTGGLLVAVAAAVAAVVSVVFRAYAVTAEPIADRLNGGPAVARQGLLNSAAQVLWWNPVLPTTGAAAAPAVVLGLVVLVGVVIAIVRPGRRFLVVAFLAVAVLACLAAGSNSDLAKLATGFWYKDKYRLYAVLPVLGVPLATLAITSLVDALRRRGAPLRGAFAGAVAAAVVLVASWAGPTLTDARAAVATVFALPATEKAGAVVDGEQRRLLERLPDIVPKGDVVVGDPWTGAILTGVYGDRTPLFPHLTGGWDDDRRVIAEGLDRWSTDPAVCAAIDDLGVRWLVADPERLWGGDPQADFFAGIDRAVAQAPDGLLTEVDREGSAVLYRVDGC